MVKHCQLLLQHHFTPNIIWFWRVLLAFSLLPHFTIAQSPTQKDSLLKVLQTLPEDTNKVNVLNELSAICRENDSKKAFEFANQAVSIAQKVNFLKGKARGLFSLGEVLQIQGAYEASITHLQKAIEAWKTLNNQEELATSFRALGIVHRLKGDFPKALDYYLKALYTFEGTNNLSGRAITSSSIGILHYKRKDYDKALIYLSQSLSLHQENLDSASVARAYNNLGNVYSDLKDYDKALFYYERYKEIQTSLKDKRRIAIALSNIGFIYAQQKKFDKAIRFYKESIEIREKLGQRKRQTYPLQYLAEAYAALNDFKQAYYYGTKALKIAEQIGAKSRAMEISKSLSKIYEETKNYKDALVFYQRYKTYADSVFNGEKSKQIAEMQTKYDTEKKEQENTILKLEVEQRNNLVVGTTIGGGLLLILAIVLYQSNRRKQKTNKVLLAQKQEIEIQTEEIMAQRDMLEQQHKDIRDSINYARKIQTAILPLKEEISASLPEHFLFYQPRDIVSGDFYWFAKIEQDTPKYVIAISDCTGHGVPGAFMSMIGNDLLNDIVKARQIIEPNVVLDLLHVGVRKALHQETGENSDGMDIALCVIDPQQKTVSYAGANSPLVYVKDGELTRIAPNKTSIGGSKTKYDKGFVAHTISYQASPVMCYLYSDGYRDQFGGEKGKKFMRPRFLELVFYISQLSMQDQRRQIEDTITEWMKQGGYDQMDDMLVMGFRLG